MTELQKEQLENYFKPIYYVELEDTADGELFPSKMRWAFYDKRTNRREALHPAESFPWNKSCKFVGEVTEAEYNKQFEPVSEQLELF